jgi:hypothetical protein
VTDRADHVLGRNLRYIDDLAWGTMTHNPNNMRNLHHGVVMTMRGTTTVLKGLARRRCV